MSGSNWTQYGGQEQHRQDGGTHLHLRTGQGRLSALFIKYLTKWEKGFALRGISQKLRPWSRSCLESSVPSCNKGLKSLSPVHFY